MQDFVQVGKPRPKGQRQLGRVTAELDSHRCVVRAEKLASVARRGGHMCFSSEAMGPWGVVTCIY